MKCPSASASALLARIMVKRARDGSRAELTSIQTMIQCRTHQCARLTQFNVAFDVGARGQSAQHLAMNRPGAAGLGDHEAMHTGAEMIVAIGAYRSAGVSLGRKVQSIADVVEQPRLELPQRRVGLGLLRELFEGGFI